MELAREVGSPATVGARAEATPAKTALCHAKGESEPQHALVASGPAIIDSGAGASLANKNQCSKADPASAAPSNAVLITAAGPEHADKEVQMELDALGIKSTGAGAG